MLTTSQKAEMNEALAEHMHELFIMFQENKEKLLNAKEASTFTREAVALMARAFIFGYGICREKRVH